MTDPIERAAVLEVVEDRMKKHSGDAPWSCIECYHGRPCIEREILLAARETLHATPTKEE